MKKSLNRPLSFVDALKVIAGLLALAAIISGIYWARAKVVRARTIKATIPRILEAVRAQRQQMIGAIEDYHAQLGFYPPDHVLSRVPLVVDARTNQLNYELNGTRYDAALAKFYLPNKKEWIDRNQMRNFFNIDCFSNSVSRPKIATNFIAGFPTVFRALDPDGDAWGVTIFDGEIIPEEVTDAFEISAWRYRSTSPEHNRAKFDLWIEMDVSGEHFLIGNWKEVE